MPRTSRTEPTQGRPMPTRLQHLSDGVSNWGKRWTKTPKKNGRNTPPGGEYNTFPVSGTTHEFSISDAPSVSASDTAVSRSKSAPSTAHRRGVSKSTIAARSSASTPTITIDPGYAPVYDMSATHPPPSPTPSTSSSRLSPFSPSSPSSPHWASRKSTDNLLGSPYQQAQSLTVPSSSAKHAPSSGEYSYAPESSSSTGTVASWDNTVAYTSELLRMLENPTSSAQGTYSQDPYNSSAYPSSPTALTTANWPTTYNAPGNTTQWSPAVASASRSQPSAQRSRPAQSAQPQRTNTSTSSSNYAPAYVSPTPVTSSQPYRHSTSSTTSSYAPAYVSPAAIPASIPTSQPSSDPIRRLKQQRASVQYIESPPAMPTYRQSSAPQVPPVHQIGGYSSAPGYTAPVPTLMQQGNTPAIAVRQQFNSHAEYAQYAAAAYVQQAQYGSEREDIRPAQHQAGYHPYRRLP